MTKAKIDIQVLLKDKEFLKDLEKAVAKAQKLNTGLKGASLTKQVNRDVKRLSKDLGNAAVAGGKLNSSLRRLGTNSKGGLGSIAAVLKGGAIVTGILAIKKAVVGAVKAFATFEHQMLSVKTLLDETSFKSTTLEKGFKNLKSNTKKVLGEFPVELEATTKALFDIISAGVDTEDAISTLKSASKLSVAGITNLSVATDGLTSALNSYNLTATDSEVVAAKFFTAQKFGKTTVEELANGFGLVASQAAALGVDLDELQATMASVTATGVRTNQAYVGLAGILSNIAKPSEKAAATAKALGIEFNLAALKEKKFSKFFSEIIQATGGSKQLLQNLIGSVRGVKVAFALASGKGVKVYNKALAELKDEQKSINTLNKAVEDQADSLTSKWKGLENAATNLSTTIGDLSQDALKGFVDSLKESITFVDTLIGKLAELNTKFKKGRDQDIKKGGVLGFLASLSKNTEISTIFKNIQEGMASVGTIALKVKGEVLETSDAYVEWKRRVREIAATNRAVETDFDRANAKQKAQIAELINTLYPTLEKAEKSVGRAALTSREGIIQVYDKQINEIVKLASLEPKHAKRAADAIVALNAEKWGKIDKLKLKELRKTDKYYNDRFALASAGLSKEEKAYLKFSIAVRSLQDKLAKGLISESTFQEALASASQEFSSFQKNLEDQANTALQKLASSWDGLMSLAKGVIKTGLQSGGKAALTKFAAIWKSASDQIISTVLGKLGNALSSLAQGAKASRTLIDAEKELQKVRAAGIEEQIKAAEKALKVTNTKTRNSVLTAEKNLNKAESVRLPRWASEEDKALRRLRIESAQKALDAAKQSQINNLKVYKEAISELKDKRNADLEAAQEAVKEAKKARDEQARTAAIDAASSTLAGAAEIAGTLAGIPGLGSIVGPIAQAAAQGPDAFKDFIDAFVDQLPVIIEAMIEGIPLLVIALIEHIPEIVEAYITGFLLGVGRLVEALATALTKGGEVAAAIITGIQDGLDAAGDWIKERWDIGWSKATDKFESVFDKWSGIFTDIWTSIKEFFGVGDGGSPGVLDKQYYTDRFSVNSLKDRYSPFATGGQVKGSGNKDTVPAILTPGELVIDRTTGPKLMDFIDNYQKQAQQPQNSELTDALLTQILSELSKPITTTAKAEVNGDTLADIILELNRDNKRLS